MFQLHLQSDNQLVFKTRCDAPTEAAVTNRLVTLFGADARLRIEQIPDEVAWQGKAIQFSTDAE